MCLNVVQGLVWMFNFVSELINASLRYLLACFDVQNSHWSPYGSFFFKLGYCFVSVVLRLLLVFWWACLGQIHVVRMWKIINVKEVRKKKVSLVKILCRSSLHEEGT
jgi:hypothetical protein